MVADKICHNQTRVLVSVFVITQARGAVVQRSGPETFNLQTGVRLPVALLGVWQQNSYSKLCLPCSHYHVKLVEQAVLVKRLTRLPLTQKNAGSNPAHRTDRNDSALWKPNKRMKALIRPRWYRERDAFQQPVFLSQGPIVNRDHATLSRWRGGIDTRWGRWEQSSVMD